MKTAVRKSEAGFSLVELMVVVAIIGILATIAVPQVNKFMAKARQSEAKGNLSTMYSCQKAFKAEYNTYFSGFRHIGYSPEGQLRYRVGYQTGGITAAQVSTQYGYPNATEPFVIATNAWCGTNGTMANGCSELADANQALTASSSAENTFVSQAVSRNIGYNQPDRWTIDQDKRLRMLDNGIN